MVILIFSFMAGGTQLTTSLLEIMKVLRNKLLSVRRLSTTCSVKLQELLSIHCVAPVRGNFHLESLIFHCIYFIFCIVSQDTTLRIL